MHSLFRVVVPALALVLTAAGCGGTPAGSTAHAAAKPATKPTAAASPPSESAPVTLSGTMTHGQPSLRSVTLSRGEALRAKVTPTAGLQVVLGVFGPPLSGQYYAKTTDTHDVNVFAEAWRSVVDSAANPGQADPYDYANDWMTGGSGNSSPGQPPAGMALLSTSWGFRDGCQDGQSQWLAFVAPADGTYDLAVLTPPDGVTDGTDSGPFTVSYSTLTHPVAAPSGFANTGTGLGGWYAAQADGYRAFFTDPSFFPAAQFSYGNSPYDQQSCGSSGSWQPVPSRELR